MDGILLSARSALQPFLQVGSLSDLFAAYKTINVNYTLAGHCLFVAAMAPDLKHRFLVHFWVTYLAGFGGGILTSILMMDPVRAPLALLANNTVGLTWFICWWLMAYSPFNIVGRIHSLPPFKLITKACVSFMRANLIISRVELAVALYPGVVAAPLILGTLAGCGGKLLTDAIRTGWAANPPALGEASAPTFVWRSAALAAGGYWAACKATALLTSQEAQALVITVLVLHSILSDILGPALTDFTYPVFRVAHAVSLIPMPAAAPAPAPAKAAARKGSEQQPQQPKPQPGKQPQQQQPAQPQQQQQPAAAAKPQQAAPATGAAKKAQQPAAGAETKASGKGGSVAAIKADSSSSKGAQASVKKTESKKSR